MYTTILVILLIVLAVIVVFSLARRKSYTAEPREPRPDEKKGTTYLKPQAEEPTVPPEATEPEASDDKGHKSP